MVVITCAPSTPAGGSGEPRGIRQFPSEVEPAHEAERLAEGHSLRASQTCGQIERRPFVEQECGSLAPTVGGERRKTRLDEQVFFFFFKNFF